MMLPLSLCSAIRASASKSLASPAKSLRLLLQPKALSAVPMATFSTLGARSARLGCSAGIQQRLLALSPASSKQRTSVISSLLAARRLASSSAANDTVAGASSTSSSGNEREPSAKPIVGWWYLFSGSLVFAIVALGGVTRLTESGLSIVEWNLIKGMKPPTSQQEWEEEFEKYKQFPEYKLLNHHMTLNEFKSIFYFEWAHRMLGRFIGLSFIIPGAFFAYKGWMSRSMKIRSLVCATLIGCQGVLGWYMVKSGLDHELMETPGAVPRVSQYWLAAHLGSAFVIYLFMLSNGFQILRDNRLKSLESLKAIVNNPQLNSFRRNTHIVAGLVFLTAMSGAFVAGLDAGLIYNEWPTMGGGFVPSDIWAHSTASPTNPNPKAFWRNFLENPATVQFDHRILAYVTFAGISSLWFMSRRLPLPRGARLAVNTLLGVAVAQVSLGIATLIYFVPVPIAAAHQSGSLTLLTVVLWLMHTLKYIK